VLTGGCFRNALLHDLAMAQVRAGPAQAAFRRSVSVVGRRRRVVEVCEVP
jgi:hypothetical protein